MIMCFMAAQDVGQLQAIRRSNKYLNTTILKNQYDIVRYALHNKTSQYYTVSRLYYNLCLPVNPGFSYLFSIARRCDIAKQLAVALATQLQKTHYSKSSDSQFPGKRFDEASYVRFIRNVLPYIHALAHFFESYRNGLFNYQFEPRFARYTRLSADTVECHMLRSIYDRETVDRICTLYGELKYILYRRLGGAHSMITMSRLRLIRGSDDFDFVKLFTFGGIEAVKDTMVQPSRARRCEILKDHFARALPDSFTRAHTLPPSTLSKIDRTAAAKIGRLIPRRMCILEDEWVGYPKELRSMDKEQDRFYEHLVTYKGDDPKLIL